MKIKTRCYWQNDGLMGLTVTVIGEDGGWDKRVLRRIDGNILVAQPGEIGNGSFSAYETESSIEPGEVDARAASIRSQVRNLIRTLNASVRERNAKVRLRRTSRPDPQSQTITVAANRDEVGS